MSTQDNLVAVITGAAGGIGAALAKRLSERGCCVVMVDRDPGALQLVALRLGLTASNSLLVTADVSQEADVRNYVDQALGRFGRIDYFANNAGIEGSPALLEDQSVEMFDKVYAVNVRGAFMGLKYVLPVMKRQGKGSIVNMSSLAGISADQSVEMFDKVYAVNVRGAFMGLKYVLPVMKRQGKGSIVNMSSLAGIS